MTAFEQYSTSYSIRLEAFLKEYPDAIENDFIQKEQREYLTEISTFEQWEHIINDADDAIKLNGVTRRGIYYTNKKILTFLNAKESANKSISDNTNLRENKFCLAMPLSIAESHFKIFTEKNSQNGLPFLEIGQLNSFIERAFCGNTKLPKQKFNQAPKGEKLQIQGVFYEFYSKYCLEYFNSGQCQDNFINLLIDNFEGWDFKNVKQNFKPKTKKRI